jgi:HlyD family secretion protein
MSFPRPSVRLLAWLLLPAVVAGIILWKKSAPVPCYIHTVARNAVIDETMGTGTLEARLAASISPKITGRLTAVLVDQGDSVTAGQSLALLDDIEAQRHLEVAEAALTAAQATAARVRTDELRMRAVLAQAQLEHARAVTLAANQTVSVAERDKAVEQLHIAEAELARAQAIITEAESQQTAAETQIALQRELLANTRLLAPFDGLVIRRDRDPGDVVTPGSSVLRIVAPTEIWVSAWVDETAAAQLAPGQPARLVFRSEPDSPYFGHVARLGRETDRETREFLVDVSVDHLPTSWTIGQRAEVYIETARHENVITVPSTFIQRRNGEPGVYRLVSGRAHWDPVQLGLQGPTLTEITAGLTTGDTVALAALPGSEIGGHRIATP